MRIVNSKIVSFAVVALGGFGRTDKKKQVLAFAEFAGANLE
jgi:hypothetical protein